MTRNKLRTVPVLLIAMLALAVGLVGTASVGNAAAAITKAQVKKIATKAATKVVKKSAPSLSVANATNATNLGGKAASSYLDNSTLYTATITTGVSSFDLVLPLAPGAYQLSYSVYASGATTLFCWFREFNGATEFLNAGDQTGTSAASGSAVMTVAAGQSVRLLCSANANFTTDNSPPVTDPIQVVATPLDSLTTTTLTTQPVSKPSLGRAGQ